jgi:hypothetical protein
MQDSHYSSNRSQSPSFLNISTDIDTSDDFGDLFAGFNNRRSQLIEGDHLLSKPPAPAVLRTVRIPHFHLSLAKLTSRQESEPLINNPPRPLPYSNRPSKTPPPLNFGKSREAEKSPYSWTRRTSHDGLMSSPPLDDSPIQEEPPPVPQHKTGMTPAGTSTAAPRTLRPSMSQESFTASGSSGDADAQMVSASVRAVRASTIRSSTFSSPSSRTEQLKQDSLGPASGSSSSGASLHTPSMTSSASSFNTHDATHTQRSNQSATPTPLGRPLPAATSNNTTPRAKQAHLPPDDEDPLNFDLSIVSAINIDGRDSLPSHAPPAKSDEPKKVYTAKQFEILKKHADKSSTGKSSESDSEPEYDDDDDDEATILEKRRQQQQKEAQHLIWRQKMTKEIGDQSSPLPGRPSFPRGNQSAPNLFGHAPKNSVSTGGSSGSSDDEDIPLGVLQAHGFPKKDQPPDPRLSSNSFVGRPVSTLAPLPQRPASPARSTAGGNRNSVLPPFARRLPTDPYMGQGDLVNPANRESMGFNRASVPQSVHMPAAAQQQLMPQVPGGLVGVIAEEERQRGLRRGSPNAQARQSTVLPPGVGPMMPMMPGMGAMGMGAGMMPGMPMMPGQGVSPDQQQLNQQMFQLMQQQAAMLEQMYSQMSQFGQTPNMPQHGFSQAPDPQARRMSMASNLRPGYPQSRTMSMVNVQPPQINQRTMSMVNLSNEGWGMQNNLMSGAASVRGLGLQNNGYAPSVAPSERSNIGQPSRYKPVQASHLADGGSTITAGSTIQPTPIAEKKKSSFFSAIIHPPHKGKGKEIHIAEEDEEDDWGSFAKNRKKTRA